MDSNKNLSEDVLPFFGQYVIIVSIRGKDAKSLNLTAKGHMKMSRKEKETMLQDPKVGWYMKNEFKSIEFKITQSLDVFSHEVQQRDLTYFTALHETNQIVSLFGHYFMALDWDYERERLYGFESFKDKDTYIDIITALPDNSKVLLYSHSKRKIYSLSREKPKGKSDSVYEKWIELRMAPPQKLSSKALRDQHSQDGELDLIDEFTFKLYDVLSSWYNPFERMETRHKYINSIADDFSDFIFGDESDQRHIMEK